MWSSWRQARKHSRHSAEELGWTNQGFGRCGGCWRVPRDDVAMVRKGSSSEVPVWPKQRAGGGPVVTRDGLGLDGTRWPSSNLALSEHGDEEAADWKTPQTCDQQSQRICALNLRWLYLSLFSLTQDQWVRSLAQSTLLDAMVRVAGPRSPLPWNLASIRRQRAQFLGSRARRARWYPTHPHSPLPPTQPPNHPPTQPPNHPETWVPGSLHKGSAAVFFGPRLLPLFLSSITGGLLFSWNCGRVGPLKVRFGLLWCYFVRAQVTRCSLAAGLGGLARPAGASKAAQRARKEWCAEQQLISQLGFFPPVCDSSGLRGHRLNPHITTMTASSTRLNDTIGTL